MCTQLEDVIGHLLPHLTTGDAFRLWRATHHDGVWAVDTTLAVLRVRMGLRPRGRHTIDMLSRRMRMTASRCRECGCTTQRRGRVCRACAGNFDSYVGQVSRRDLFRFLPAHVALRYEGVPIPPSSPCYPGRRHVFWCKDVKAHAHFILMGC